MPSTSSFLGKCVTVLIGMALSWATVTNASFSEAVGGLLGEWTSKSEMPRQEVFPTAREVSNPKGSQHSARLAGSNLTPQIQTNTISAPIESSGTEEERILTLSNELKEMGATYLRMERLTGDDGVWYRVRCDLAGAPTPVKCSLEATRKSAIEAIEVVAKAVRHGFERPQQLAELR